MTMMVCAFLWLAAEEAHEASPPLIDVDGTLFLQFALFVIAIFILRALVFRPFLQARAEREDKIDGERNRAQEMDHSCNEKLANYESRMEQAKHAGQLEWNRLRQEARLREQEMVEQSRIEAARLVEENRQAARRSGETARKSLASQVDTLARRLASRVLGREIA